MKKIGKYEENRGNQRVKKGDTGKLLSKREKSLNREEIL